MSGVQELKGKTVDARCGVRGSSRSIANFYQEGGSNKRQEDWEGGGAERHRTVSNYQGARARPDG